MDPLNLRPEPVQLAPNLLILSHHFCAKPIDVIPSSLYDTTRTLGIYVVNALDFLQEANKIIALSQADVIHTVAMTRSKKEDSQTLPGFFEKLTFLVFFAWDLDVEDVFTMNPALEKSMNNHGAFIYPYKQTMPVKTELIKTHAYNAHFQISSVDWQIIFKWIKSIFIKDTPKKPPPKKAQQKGGKKEASEKEQELEPEPEPAPEPAKPGQKNQNKKTAYILDLCPGLCGALWAAAVLKIPYFGVTENYVTLKKGVLFEKRSFNSFSPFSES